MGDTVDTMIAAIATRQGGHISRVQLLALGLGREAIAYRIRIGRLIRVYSGLYAVGNLPSNPRDRAAGALLACGPRAVLSHGTAAAIWDITTSRPPRFELTTTGDRRPSGLRVHRSRTLTRDQIARHGSLRVTTPARTALDIAPRYESKRLVRIVNELRLANRLTIDELRDLTRRLPGHPGTRHINPLIVEDRGPSRSELECAFRQFHAAHKLPDAVYNADVAGYEVDVLFPLERVIVEMDGYGVHKTREHFESDRARDAEILAVTGIPTIRLTDDQFRNHHAKVAAQLERILGRRRAQIPAADQGAPEGLG